jgi:hypothetical protein
MGNDAKLALVIGVGLVIAVAIVFYHKDLVNRPSADDKTPANVGNPPTSPPADSKTLPRRPLSARPMRDGTTRQPAANGDSISNLSTVAAAGTDAAP